MSGRLEGKVAIVTGAGSGIGKAAAALFAEEGATVIAADLKGTQISVDAGDEDQVAALIAATVERCGGLEPAYSASKAGVINLVQVAAQQLSGSGVRVNALCPGLIETGLTQPIFDAARSAGKEERIGRLNPLRRGGVPREVAAAALFLACAESSYVNGHALIVDGGLSSSHPFTRQDYGKSAF